MLSSGDADSSSQNFAGRPIVYYFLSVLITALLVDPYFVGRIYSFLSRGSDWQGVFKPPDDFVGPSTVADVLAILRSSVTLALFWNIFSVPLWLILFAPVYFIALYVSRRWHFRDDLSVAVFWVVTWLFAAAWFPAFLAIIDLFNPLSPWNAWRRSLLDDMSVFVPVGVICGIIHFGLSFRGRRRNRNSITRL